MPVLTIFCAFTRRWAVDEWLANLANVEHDPANTNLCFIIDLEEHYIANALKKFAESRGYRSFHVKMNTGWRPNELKLSIRRSRIAEVKNQSKDLISLSDGEIIICFEDDTMFDRLSSFEPLVNPLLEDPRVGFVEGVQMGRWGANMIGAWRFDDIKTPTQVRTCLPSVGYEAIDGGGWYGYATTRDLYLQCEYYTSSAQPWGPDVNFGLWLRGQGYKCLVNWDLIFGHKDFNNTAYPDDPKWRLVELIWNKDKQTGKWERTDREPTRY